METTNKSNSTTGSGLPAAPCSVFAYMGHEYKFNDVVHGLTTGVKGRLIQVRIGCGQFGSNIMLIRLRCGALQTIENDMIQPSRAIIPKADDSAHQEYTIMGEWPEIGFIVYKPSQPQTHGSLALAVTAPNVKEQPPALTRGTKKK